MDARSAHRMPHKYSEGIYKNKSEIDRYKRIANDIIKKSKTYDKLAKLSLICISILILMFAITPIIIIIKLRLNHKHITNDSTNNSQLNQQSISTSISNSYNDII